jgi:hypothetical protein
MLSVEKCRELLGPEYDLSDDEIESLRGLLVGMGDIVANVCKNRRAEYCLRFFCTPSTDRDYERCCTRMMCVSPSDSSDP